MANAGAVVDEFQKALERGDFRAMRALMHDDMTFRGPFEAFGSPEPYLASLAKLHTIIKAIRVKHRFVDGDEVCSLYEMDTDSPAGTAFICEWFTLRKGKVASVRAVFDARPFAGMFHA